MADTKIEWTRGDDGVPGKTWNPVRGCTKVSAGCKHCYAERFAERFRGVPGHPFEQGFDLRLVPEALDLPLRWRKPRRVFVNSMSDLFHEDVPFRFIANVFGIMQSTPRHTYQILTKRADRMREFVDWFRCEWLGGGDAFPREYQHVWLGVSVEHQRAADERIPPLLATPAAVRFLSCEPLLGPVDLEAALSVHDQHGEPSGPRCNSGGGSAMGWVIVGGESGPGARPMRFSWAENILAQCREAGVPVFIKQLGAVAARECMSADRKGGDMTLWPPALRVREFPGATP